VGPAVKRFLVHFQDEISAPFYHLHNNAFIIFTVHFGCVRKKLDCKGLTQMPTCKNGLIFSVVTVIEIGTKTAVFQLNRTEPKPRFYASLLAVSKTELH